MSSLEKPLLKIASLKMPSLEKPLLKTASSKTAVLKKGIPKQHYCRKQPNKSDIIFRHINKESLKWS